MMGETDLLKGDETFGGKSCSWEGAELVSDQAEQKPLELKKLEGNLLIGREIELTGLGTPMGRDGGLLKLKN